MDIIRKPLPRQSLAAFMEELNRPLVITERFIDQEVQIIASIGGENDIILYYDRPSDCGDSVMPEAYGDDEDDAINELKLLLSDSYLEFDDGSVKHIPILE